MNENKKRFIPTSWGLVEVTEELYREYYRIGRRERYLAERDVVHGTVSYNNLDTDEMRGEETIPDIGAKSVQQIVEDIIMIGKLHQCLDWLFDDERELIDALFFKGYSERGWSAATGIPQKTINDRKNKILAKLKKMLENKRKNKK